MDFLHQHGSEWETARQLSGRQRFLQVLAALPKFSFVGMSIGGELCFDLVPTSFIGFHELRGPTQPLHGDGLNERSAGLKQKIAPRAQSADRRKMNPAIIGVR